MSYAYLYENERNEEGPLSDADRRMYCPKCKEFVLCDVENNSHDGCKAFDLYEYCPECGTATLEHEPDEEE